MHFNHAYCADMKPPIRESNIALLSTLYFLVPLAINLLFGLPRESSLCLAIFIGLFVVLFVIQRIREYRSRALRKQRTS